MVSRCAGACWVLNALNSAMRYSAMPTVSTHHPRRRRALEIEVSPNTGVLNGSMHPTWAIRPWLPNMDVSACGKGECGEYKDVTHNSSFGFVERDSWACAGLGSVRGQAYAVGRAKARSRCLTQRFMDGACEELRFASSLWGWGDRS